MTRDDVQIGQIFLVDLTRKDGMIIPDPIKQVLPKYVVIIGFEEGVRYNAFYCIISSDIYHPSETFPIYKRQYSRFSKARSNLDLSDVKVIAVDRLLSGKYITELTPEDREAVLKHITESEYFNNRQKRQFGLIK